MPALFDASPIVSIDALDVVVVAARQSGVNTYCTALLSAAQQVPVDLTSAALVAAANAAADITSGSLFAGPFDAVEWSDPVYVAGAAVRSVRATPNGLGCSLVFGASPGMLTVPNVTRADMVTALNATATPAPPADPVTYNEAGLETMTVTGQPGTTITQANELTWARQGQEANAPDAGADDAMNVGIVVQVQTTGAFLGFLIDGFDTLTPAGAPIAEFSDACVAQGYDSGAPVAGNLRVYRGSSNRLVVQSDTATVGTQDVAVRVTGIYRVDAS